MSSLERRCGESLNKQQMHKMCAWDNPLELLFGAWQRFLKEVHPSHPLAPALFIFSLCIDCLYSPHVVAKEIHHSYPSCLPLMLLLFRQQDMGRNMKYKMTLSSWGKKKLKIGHCVSLVFQSQESFPTVWCRGSCHICRARLQDRKKSLINVKVA